MVINHSATYRALCGGMLLHPFSPVFPYCYIWRIQLNLTSLVGQILRRGVKMLTSPSLTFWERRMPRASRQHWCYFHVCTLNYYYGGSRNKIQQINIKAARAWDIPTSDLKSWSCTRNALFDFPHDAILVWFCDTPMPSKCILNSWYV